uniref:MULE domain-containing protein n=1 Tax=Globodera pallida TaxID=36090 RepID=A0A183CNH5_GLOPA
MIRNQVEFLQKSRKRKYLTEINNNLDDDDTGQDVNVEGKPPTIQAQDDDEEERPVVRFECGYRYIKKMAHYWTCALRGCPANATIVEEDENGMFGTIGLKKHIHLPEPHKQEAEARRQKIKDCVKEEPRLKPTRLLAQVRRSAPEEAYVAMSSDNALREMMRRQKKKILGNVDSTDPLAFVIPAVLREKHGEDILLYDSRNFRPNERDVVLIFGSEKTLEILRTNRTWHIDGTFKCAPALWEQCFVIGASVYHRMCVCIWALLPGKNKKYYDEVLHFLREKIAPATPSKILSDFEKAELLAVRATFPAVDILCCMFHYGQSIYRSFKRLGLVPLYGQKNERGDAVRNSFRSVLSLPLLPPTVIRRAFTLIVDASPNGLEEFFLYFARTYIGLTQQQTEQGAGAFECSNPCRSVDSASDNDSSAFSGHFYSHSHTQFGLDMSSPSAASWPATTASRHNSFSNASSYTIHQERLARLLFSYSTSDASSTTPSPDMVLLLVDGCISCNNPAGMGSALNLSRKQAVVCPGYLNYYKHTTVQLEEGNASSFMYGVVLMERLCPMVGIAGVLPNETNLVIEPLDYKYEISLVVTHNCTGKEKNVSLKFPTIDVFTTDQTMHDRVMQIRGLKLELDTLEDGVLDLSNTDNMDLNGHFILATIASEESGPTMPPPSPNDDGTEMPPMNNGTGQPLEPKQTTKPGFMCLVGGNWDGTEEKAMECPDEEHYCFGIGCDKEGTDRFFNKYGCCADGEDKASQCHKLRGNRMPDGYCTCFIGAKDSNMSNEYAPPDKDIHLPPLNTKKSEAVVAERDG